MEIEFIKWKWIVTKDIDEWLISISCQIPIKMYEKLHNYIWKTLTLEVTHNDSVNEYITYIDEDVSTPIWFSNWHWVVKLKVIVKNRLLLWTVITGTLKLKLD